MSTRLRIARFLAWTICLVGVTLSGLTALLALLLTSYEHLGASPWSSPWAALGSALLAACGPMASGFAIHHLLERRLWRAVGLAALALPIPPGWYIVWGRLWT